MTRFETLRARARLVAATEPQERVDRDDLRLLIERAAGEALPSLLREREGPRRIGAEHAFGALHEARFFAQA